MFDIYFQSMIPDIVCINMEKTPKLEFNVIWKDVHKGQNSISFSSLKEKLQAIITIRTSSDIKMSHLLVTNQERELLLSAGLLILSFKVWIDIYLGLSCTFLYCPGFYWCQNLILSTFKKQSLGFHPIKLNFCYLYLHLSSSFCSSSHLFYLSLE